MAKRYKLIMEYEGSGFCGWQRQALNLTTVQGVVEKAIALFCGEDTDLQAAGRTDSGVHALAQVAHCDLQRDDVSPDTMRDAINALVRPHPVAILKAELVDEKFHARYSAKRRRYRYHICNRRPPPVIIADRVWHIIRPLDIAAMQEAANLLIGHHDFSTFRALNCQADSPHKTLETLEISQNGQDVMINTTARSYLYHQVRNMVGTLSLVGLHQWSLDDFAHAFKAARRSAGGPTAPPQGLFFLGPDYEGKK
jgi:tRNA pseudouridine38-40 synthase